MEEYKDDTFQFIGSIIAGMVAALVVWFLLTPGVEPLAVVILAFFVFAATSWGIYEAFSDGYSSETKGFERTHKRAPMAQTDRDTWVSSVRGDAALPKASKPQMTALSSKPVSAVSTKRATATSTKAAPKTATRSVKSKSVSAKGAAVAKKSSDGPERLKKPKGKADDLKLISGVGPKLESKLNGLGFWHFSQIANWKKKDIAVVDDELSFKGRIERDDWVRQARALAKGGVEEYIKVFGKKPR